MKSKKAGIGITIILLLTLLILTGCGNLENQIATTQGEKSTNTDEYKYVADEATEYVNGYNWLHIRQVGKDGRANPDSYKTVLVDKEGKIVFETDYATHTDVHSNYFVLNNEELYNIQEGKADLGEYNSYEKEIGTDNGERDVLELTNTIENFDGSFTDTVYMDLSNMQKIEDIGDFVPYGDSKPYGGDNAYKGNFGQIPFELTDKDDLEDFETKGKRCYKCVENNGYFTVMDEDNQQCFEPIEGNALDVDESTMSVLMTDGDKLYVVDLQGNKTEIQAPNYSYYNHDIINFADGMICVEANDEVRIFKNTGEEIMIHD